MRRTTVRTLEGAISISRAKKPLSRSFATVKDPNQKVDRFHLSCAHAHALSLSQDPSELDNISELPNGVRVATESLPGPFSAVGIYIDAGSRYEDESLRGVSHIVDRLAFKSTKNKTADEMLESLDALGGNTQCASSREALMYQSATFNNAVPTTLGLLAETIRDPLITEEEVQQQVETAGYEIQEIWSKPELIIPELLHMVAYKDNTLGNPLLCPREKLSRMNSALIQKYRDAFYRPERIVVAFAGVEHEEALRLTTQYFGDMKPNHEPILSQSGSQSTLSDSVSQSSNITTSSSASTYHSPQSSSKGSGILSKIPLFKNLSTSAPHHASVSPLDPSLLQDKPIYDITQPSHYTGGYLALPPLPPPANNLSVALSHVHLAFEALPISSPDIYALATLQTLLGGGGSFSAGGPGKGMYSRLYTNVLNQHGWVESCIAFNHSYTDSGLFGIAASCLPGRVGSMVDVMCRELQSLGTDSGFRSLQVAEVQRAKNQLRSSLLMNLESRLVELEDLGRQVQVHGRKVGVREMCRRIEEVTIEDLRRVARDVFTGKIDNHGHGTGAPTVVIQEGEEEGGGRVKQIAWEEVQGRIERWKLGRM